MKNLLFILFFPVSLFSQTYQQIHEAAIVVDTHNDILTESTEKGMVFDTDLRGKTHSDLTRWKQGGLDVQIYSVFCDGSKKYPYAYANRQMDTADAVAKRNPNKIVRVANSKELSAVVAQHKIATMFGVEGGHMIENDLEKLDALYKRGTRYMTLTWNNSTDWATSAFDERFKKDLKHKGLTDFGKKVVKRMNKLGMLVDISHVGETTFWDVMKTTKKPVIASHSSVYHFNHHQRNLKDEQIKAVAKNGGVIQVNFYSGFLDSNFMKRKDAFMVLHKAERDSIMASGKPDHIADVFLYQINSSIT